MSRRHREKTSNIMLSNRRLPALFFVAMLLSLAPARGQAADSLPEAPPIAIVPQDGFNLVIKEQFAPDYIIARINREAYNWFAGTLTNLPINKPITIGFSMANEKKALAGDVKKWRGLRPVLTYADPMQYETYEWFMKDAQGRWISGDPLKTGDARFAGTERLPHQRSVPVTLAEECLSKDQAYWCAWREMDEVTVLTEANICRITAQYTQSSATIAMRVPYPVAYQDAFIQRLRDAHIPGLQIDTLGTTPKQRTLDVIRIDDYDVPPRLQDRRTILVYAREHPTECASSWVVYGMVSAVIRAGQQANARHTNCTWLFIPMLDPDGCARSCSDRMAELFIQSKGVVIPPETECYKRYLTDYVRQNGPIDLAVSFHNVESAEFPNFFCPTAAPDYLTTVNAVNRGLFQSLTERQYLTGQSDHPWMTLAMPARLFGWCATTFGSLPLIYEVNDRFPAQRLNLAQLEGMGTVIAEHLATWLQSSEGEEWHRQVVTRHHQ